jgi:pyrroloquinoline quinone biosynthesis protein B
MALSVAPLAILAALLVACSCPKSASEPPATPAPDQPYVLVLGTAQDAGLPQIGCAHDGCVRARANQDDRRLVASLLLCDPRSGKRWLFDATPDLREQVASAQGHPASRKHDVARPPLFDGIFLTHAHMGHYTGLMYLGRESYGAKQQRVFATARMSGFLRDNGPWSQLVSLQNIVLQTLTPDQTVSLATDISVTSLLVPHRDEFSDTLAFVLRGPNRSVLYLPDIDKWDKWSRRIEDVIGDVDVAMIDGTFFSDGEIPGRSMADIPHPFITESIDQLRGLNAKERGKVLFTHLNHSNPAADPNSGAAQQIRAAGMAVARDMQILPL